MIHQPKTTIYRPDMSKLAALFREVRIEGLAAFVPKNSLNELITPAVSKRFKVPTTVKAGDPIVLGGSIESKLAGLAAVALSSYDSRDGMATLAFDGAHSLTVTAQFGSPVANKNIKPGDALYAAIYEAGAVYDLTTNCWTGFVLDNNNGGIPFGNYWDTTDITAGTAVAAMVRLKLGGGNA